MERIIECDEFIFARPNTHGDTFKLNIVKRKYGIENEFETEIIEITDTAWAVYIMSSETGNTVDSYHWTRKEGEPIALYSKN